MKARRSPRRKGKRGKIRIQRSRPLIIFAGVVAVLAVFAAGSTAYALNLENHDPFCASCHSEPESKYVQQSLDKNAATLASFHAQSSVRCIDCHSGSGPLGRLVGLSQGSQDLLSYYSGNYHNPAITTTKLGDESCLKCHADVSTNQTFNNHFHLFLPRWQAVDPQAAHCIDCHTAHTAGITTQLFLEQAPVQQICENCHAAIRE